MSDLQCHYRKMLTGQVTPTETATRRTPLTSVEAVLGVSHLAATAYTCRGLEINVSKKVVKISALELSSTRALFY